jgi:hypothetical protein
MGMAEMGIAEPERPDRLLLISAFAMVLLAMLGAAGDIYPCNYSWYVYCSFSRCARHPNGSGLCIKWQGAGARRDGIVSCGNQPTLSCQE